MRKLLVFVVCLLSCSCSPPKISKRYAVVCPFGSVVHETEDKDEAFQRAKDLTYFGRVLPSKPTYFVIEK